MRGALEEVQRATRNHGQALERGSGGMRELGQAYRKQRERTERLEQMFEELSRSSAERWERVEARLRRGPERRERGER